MKHWIIFALFLLPPSPRRCAGRAGKGHRFADAGDRHSGRGRPGNAYAHPPDRKREGADNGGPPEAKNLKQVKVGDVVTVTYTLAHAFRLNPTKAVRSEATTATRTAKPGEKPAGVIGTVVTIVARVEAIDLKENTVTFKGPKGNPGQ